MNKSVLIIEDHEDSCRALCQILKRRALHAECAHTFAEGLACVRGGHFDLAIVDLILPDSPDAMETLRRSTELNISRIIMTGFSDPAIIRECSRQKVEFCLKPIVPEEVLEKVLTELEWQDPSEPVEEAIIANHAEKLADDSWWKRKSSRIATILGAATLVLLVFTNLRGGFRYIWESAQSGALSDYTIRQNFTDVNNRITAMEEARKEDARTLRKISHDIELLKEQDAASIEQRSALRNEVKEVKDTTRAIYDHLLRRGG